MARTKKRSRVASKPRTPLDEASFRGESEEVKRLLQQQPPPPADAASNNKNAAKMTPIHWASLKGHVEVFLVIREHFMAQEEKMVTTTAEEERCHEPGSVFGSTTWLAAVNAKDQEERTPLQLATDKPMVQCLLENGAEIEVGGGVALSHACSKGDMELVQLLLDAAVRKGVVQELVNSGSSNFLRSACWQGHFQVAKLLLQNGADWKEEQSANCIWARPPFQFSIDALPRTCLKEKYSKMNTKEEAIKFVDLIVEKEILYNQLVQAVENRDLDLATKLLDKDGAFPNTLNRQSQCQSPLRLTVAQNNVDFARKLLEQYGANVNSGGSFLYDAPLIDVTNKPEGRRDMFQLLLQSKGVNVNVSGRGGCYTPLHLACRNGEVEMVQSLLERGADVHAKTDDSNGGCPPIHFACRLVEDEDAEGDRKVKIIRLLLQYGSNTEARDFDNGWTPLHLLAGGRRRSLTNQGKAEVEAVELLLDHGANVESREGKSNEDEDHYEDEHEQGGTALNLAIVRGRNYDIARVLITKGGADVHIRSGILMSDGLTNLHSLCFLRTGKRKLKLIKLLVEKESIGGDDDSPSLLEARYGDEGRNALHLACEHSNYHVVKVLLAKGANLFAATGSGHSCSDLAQEPHTGDPQESFAQCFGRTVQLARACRENNIESIRSMFPRSQNQEQQSMSYDVFPQVKIPETGQYVLHYVCQFGLMEATKRLVAKGADIDLRRDADGKSAGDLAREAGHTDLVEWIQQQKKGETPSFAVMTQEEINNHLVELLEEGDDDCTDVSYIQVVRDCIVNGGADVNYRISYDFNKTPLHIASGYGDLDLAKLLIDHGANVNAKDTSLSTPLHASAGCRSVAITALLLANGADVLAADAYGNTPLHIAAKWHRKGILARLLLSHGANILATNASLRAPPDLLRNCGTSHFRTHRAIWQNTSKLVQAVKEPETAANLAVADWNDKVVFGQVMIHRDNDAPSISWSYLLDKSVKYVTDCQLGKLESTEQFARLDFFRQTETSDTAGEFLLHFFCRSGNLPFSQHLVNRCGAEVNSQRKDGLTPLALAAKHGHCDIVEWLLSMQESFTVALDKPDIWGNTPLHHACRQGNLDIVKLFVYVNKENTASLLSKRNWLSETPKDSAMAHDRSDVVTHLENLAIS